MSVKTISNNWDLSAQDSLKLLEKWLELHKNKMNDLNTEYVVRGTSEKGNPVIAVLFSLMHPEFLLSSVIIIYFFIFQQIVSYKKLKKLDTVLAKHQKTLYAVETSSNSRRLNVSRNIEIKCTNLILASELREVKGMPFVPTPATKSLPVKSIPTESASTSNGKVETIPSSKPQKTTNSSASVSTMFANQQKKNDAKVEAQVKVEKTSPTTSGQVAPSVKESPKKKGINKKVVNGKGSISSFFNAKPNVSSTKPQKSIEITSPPSDPEVKKPGSPIESLPVKNREKVIDMSAKEIPKKKLETPLKNRKRTISDSDSETIPNTPDTETISQIKKKTKPAAKKTVKQKPNAKKRSRIIALADSSEEDEPTVEEEPAEKFIKFDEEDSPKKENTNLTNKTVTQESGVKKKRKAKRMITQTKEDEDGYMSKFLNPNKFNIIYLDCFYFYSHHANS